MTKTTWHSLRNWLILVALPLTLGGVFYRFLRSNRPAVLGAGPALSFVPHQMLQSFPSLLWSLALCSAMLMIWKPNQITGRLLVTGFVALISVLFECWQAANFGRGTFDWNDCLFSLAGCLVSALVFQKLIHRENLN